VGQVTPPRPLAEEDDLSHFNCGRESLNGWLRRHACQNHTTGLSRVNAICEAGTGVIVGYVTLSAAQIEREFLATNKRRNKPDRIPVTLLGQLAIDRAHQGAGHARSLLLFALGTALRASREIASFGVITHPLDDEVRGFYARWGFEDLPFDPRRGMIVRMIDLEKSGFS
jgi:hypothetical protein